MGWRLAMHPTFNSTKNNFGVSLRKVQSEFERSACVLSFRDERRAGERNMTGVHALQRIRPCSA